MTKHVLMSVGGVTIEMEEVGDLPPSAFQSRRVSGLKLPFQDWFTQAQGSKSFRHIFLPNAFWVERGSKPDPKATKNKLYKAHADWRKLDQGRRKGEVMKLLARKQGELDDKGRPFPSDGMSIYLRCEQTPAA